VTKINTRRFISALFMVASTSASAAETKSTLPGFTNLKGLEHKLQLEHFRGKKFERKPHVYVLDEGFAGYEAEKGKGLPTNVDYEKGPPGEADKHEFEQDHGAIISKLLNEMALKSDAKLDYELHLYYTSGLDKFTAAVDAAIKDQEKGNTVVVLNAQVWDWGGNGDGKGFFNTVVDKATKAGIVWINAAGNFGGLTRWAPVQMETDDKDRWVTFKDKNDKAEKGVQLKCDPQGKLQCDVRLTLAWNSFSDDRDVGTNKDLDLYFFDSKGKQLGVSALQQQEKPDPKDSKSTKVPREIIKGSLNPGEYTVRVKVSSDNFTADKDKLRITVKGEGLSIDNPTMDESLLPPADNAGVLTIGSNDFDHASQSVSLKIPTIKLPSIIDLDHSEVPTIMGTSTSATLAAVVAILELGTDGDADKDSVAEVLQAITDGTPLSKIKKKPKVEKVEDTAPVEAPAEVAAAQADSDPIKEATKTDPAAPEPVVAATPDKPKVADKTVAATPAAPKADDPKLKVIKTATEKPAAATTTDEDDETKAAKARRPAKGSKPAAVPTADDDGAPSTAKTSVDEGQEVRPANQRSGTTHHVSRKCLRPAVLAFNSSALEQLIFDQQGHQLGQPVFVNGHYAILFNFDILAQRGVAPEQRTQPIYITPNGLVPLQQLQMNGGIQPNDYEVIVANIPACPSTSR
jgi:hypothetical protein